VKHDIVVNIVDIKPGDKVMSVHGMRVTVRRREDLIEPWRLAGAKKEDWAAEDIEDWLSKLDLNSVKVHDPKRLRSIGRALRNLEEVQDVDFNMAADADLRLTAAISEALDSGESWFAIGRPLGESGSDAKRKYSWKVAAYRDEEHPRDLRYLRAVGEAVTDFERVVKKHEATPTSAAYTDAETNVIKTISEALTAGETWANVARVVGDNEYETKRKYAVRVTNYRNQECEKHQKFAKGAVKDISAAVAKDKVNDSAKYKKGEEVILHHRTNDARLGPIKITRVEWEPHNHYLSLVLDGIDHWFTVDGSDAEWKVVMYKPVPTYQDGQLALVTGSTSGREYLAIRSGGSWHGVSVHGAPGQYQIIDDVVARVELLGWYRKDAVEGERVKEIQDAVCSALGEGSSFVKTGSMSATVRRAVAETIKVMKTGLLPEEKIEIPEGRK
jgi:hypothetical protein